MGHHWVVNGAELGREAPTATTHGHYAQVAEAKVWTPSMSAAAAGTLGLKPTPENIRAGQNDARSYGITPGADPSTVMQTPHMRP